MLYVMPSPQAQIYLELDQPFESIRYAESAISHTPHNTYAWLTLARAQLNHGDVMMGMRSLQTCIRLQPCDNEAWDEMKRIQHGYHTYKQQQHTCTHHIPTRMKQQDVQTHMTNLSAMWEETKHTTPQPQQDHDIIDSEQKSEKRSHETPNHDSIKRMRVEHTPPAHLWGCLPSSTRAVTITHPHQQNAPTSTPDHMQT